MRHWAIVLGRTLNFRTGTVFTVEVGNGKSPYTVIHRGADPHSAAERFKELTLDEGCKKRVSMVNLEGDRFTVAIHKTVKPV